MVSFQARASNEEETIVMGVQSLIQELACGYCSHLRASTTRTQKGSSERMISLVLFSRY